MSDEQVNILIADDDPGSLLALETILEGLEHNLIRASTGPEVLRHLLQYDCAVLILDVRMPGMDGFEVARHIRQRGARWPTPIILLSAAYQTEQDILTGYAAGAVDYLIKPVVPELLRRKVAAFVQLFQHHRVLQRQAARLHELERLEQVTKLAQSQVRQLRSLADAAVVVNAELSVERSLQLITDQAREIIGAHQSVTSLTPERNWAKAIISVSFSDKYAAFRTYDARPTGTGIYSVVCQTNRPMRLTQAELHAHPAWKRHSDQADKHPPLRGWLAAPMVRRDGVNIGVIQLSDKYEGDFTENDEALLVQLAHLASVAIENAQLFKAAQQARREAEEASRLKDEFLATLSHELRTPLNAILGFAELLEAELLGPDETREAIQVIKSNAAAQTKLIEDLLDVSRIISGKLRLSVQPVALADVVTAAIETTLPAAVAKGIHLADEIDPAAGRVWGDPARLQQVAWNLLSNAIKFTPQGGSVKVGLQRHNGYVELSVADTGAGISPEFLPYVFERFRQADSSTTRQYGGLGLGLAIVRQLVELHGGTVGVQSPGEGQGATFTVRLPLMVESQPAAEHTPQTAAEGLAKPGSSRVSLHGIRVLVVDDQRDALMLVDRVLTASGAEVTPADSTDQALEQLASCRPHVLVSDIAMPGRDGYALIREVRERGYSAEELPAIALTAFARPQDRSRARESGYQVHLSKPLEARTLVAAVASLAKR